MLIQDSLWEKNLFPSPGSFLIIKEFNTVLSSLNITNFLITIIGLSKGDKSKQQKKKLQTARRRQSCGMTVGNFEQKVFFYLL